MQLLGGTSCTIRASFSIYAAHRAWGIRISYQFIAISDLRFESKGWAANGNRYKLIQPFIRQGPEFKARLPCPRRQRCPFLHVRVPAELSSGVHGVQMPSQRSTLVRLWVSSENDWPIRFNAFSEWLCRCRWKDVILESNESSNYIFISFRFEMVRWFHESEEWRWACSRQLLVAPGPGAASVLSAPVLPALLALPAPPAALAAPTEEEDAWHSEIVSRWRRHLGDETCACHCVMI